MGDTHHWNPFLSDWYILSAMGAFPLGNHCKQWEWGITSRAEGRRCTSTHTKESLVLLHR